MMAGAIALYEEALYAEAQYAEAQYAEALYEEAQYEEALPEQAAALSLRTADGRRLPLQLSRWCGPPDTVDQELLRHCRGPVLDVGCGPGRLTVALTKRGISALGVDISWTAVARVRQAGAPALRRSVFDPLPGQGRWATVLLADGNIGIGGRPSRLLYRCAELLAPGGQLLVEVEPGDADEQLTAWLEHPDGRRGPVFPWALVGTAALSQAASDAGLDVTRQWRHQDRAFVCAARRSPARSAAPVGVTARLKAGLRRRLGLPGLNANASGWPRTPVGGRPESAPAAVSRVRI